METATAAQVQLLKHLLSAICFCSVCCNNRFAVLRFCNHSYDYRPNRTPPSPLTSIYQTLTIALFQTLMNVPRQATVATVTPPVRIQLVRTLVSVGVGLVETATPVQVQLLKLIFLLK